MDPRTVEVCVSLDVETVKMMEDLCRQRFGRASKKSNVLVALLVREAYRQSSIPVRA